MVATKKDRGKKGQKTFYPCGYDTDGGPWLSADHFLHFYGNHEQPCCHGPQYAEGYRKREDETKVKQSGALTIMLGKGRPGILL